MDNVDISKKAPEQIFNELTANMDTRSKYEYIKYMHNNIFAGRILARFLYKIKDFFCIKWGD